MSDESWKETKEEYRCGTHDYEQAEGVDGLTLFCTFCGDIIVHGGGEDGEPSMNEEEKEALIDEIVDTFKEPNDGA